MNNTGGDLLKTIERKLLSGVPVDGPKLAQSLLPGDRPDLKKTDQKPAAVLIPVRKGNKCLSIIFTQRPESMPEHPGQISFPGGKSDAGEPLVETALREAEEEIGLSRHLVKVIGELPVYRTITNYAVTPVIGLVEGAFEPVPDHWEVDECFEVPLAFFLNKTNAKKHTLVQDGKERSFYAFQYKKRFIWGATAAMLVNFREVLFAYARE